MEQWWSSHAGSADGSTQHIQDPYDNLRVMLVIGSPWWTRSLVSTTIYVSVHPPLERRPGKLSLLFERAAS